MPVSTHEISNTERVNPTPGATEITEDLSAHRWKSAYMDAQAPTDIIRLMNEQLASDDVEVREAIADAKLAIQDTEGGVHMVTPTTYIAWLGIQVQMHGVSYAGETPKPVEAKDPSKSTWFPNYPA